MPSEQVADMLGEAEVPMYGTPQECAPALYARVRYTEIKSSP